MGDFFHGWRRTAGAVTLGLACQWTMRPIVSLAGLLMFAGCLRDGPQPQLPSVQGGVGALASDNDQASFTVITVPPDPLLDQMRLLYSPEHPEWPQIVDAFIENCHPILRHVIRELENNKKLSPEIAMKIYERIDRSPAAVVDGQRILWLMETACYADVTCHPIEYPLRVATREYVKAHIDSREVKAVLNWICKSYHTGLPLAVPDDQTSPFHGLQIEALMQGRLAAYATNLLDPTPIPK